MFDYTNIDQGAIESGVAEAISRAGEVLDQAVAVKTTTSFANTLQPLDDIGDILSRADAQFGFLGYAHPDESIRRAGKEAEHRLRSFGVELIFREDLYRAVSRFAETAHAGDLEGERRRFLEFVQRDLRRAGHELDPEARQELKQRTHRLVELGVKFQQNIDAADDVLQVDRDDLEGLPDEYAGSLDKDEETGRLEITMAYPHVVPFMENANRRDLRERLTFMYNNRAADENKPILEEVTRLRQECADILGYGSWAHYVLEERMAKSPDRVTELYDGLIPPLIEQGQKDIDAMTHLLEADTGDSVLQLWDWRYYDTKQRKTDYGVDQFEVAKYLPLENVLEGLFQLTSEVFGLTYERLDNTQAWHPDVTFYAIRDAASGDVLAHFYLDLFPREGKFSHAAVFPMLQGRRVGDDGYQNPVCAMEANFTKPTANSPSLLQHRELVTLFHEFGHVLHNSLARCELGRFSGANVERDFVEAPSQIMENWVWRSDVLKRFARHYQTGELIPDALVDQLVAARRLNKAISHLRQIQFGLLDQELHAPGEDKDLDDITRRSAEVTLMPYHEGTFFPASFGHLMGYDASYYGYMWSEVFGDDMFSRFEAEGVTNPEVGMAYRKKVLERGGTLDADDILVGFLGRQPDNSAFLRKLGIAGTDG